MYKLGCVFIPLLALLGCASPMPDQYYESVPWDWYVMNVCATKGQMPAETAATGRRLISQTLSNYTYDRVRLNYSTRIATLGEAPVTQEMCNTLAVKIIEKQHVLPSQYNQSTEPANFGFPKQTTCNRIGTQTFFTTS